MINPVAEFLALITRKKRYKPSIVWSSALWTHNVFRVWELIAWRPVGIRPSTLAWNDDKGVSHEIAYSLEGQLALFEVWFRSLFEKLSFKIIVVPQLQLAGMARGGFTPYRFAIAFENEADNGISNTATLSKTNTGSELLLLGFIVGDINATDNLSGVTYNSVAMSFGASKRAFGAVPTDRWLDIYVLGNPATGANNMVTSGNTFNNLAAISYTGCNATGQPDGSGNNSAATSPNTVSVNVTASNCWLVGISYAPAGQAGTGGSAIRNPGSAFAGGAGLIDSDAVVGTGSQSLSCTATAGLYQFLAVSIKPTAIVVGGTINRAFTLLGVGQ